MSKPRFLPIEVRNKIIDLVALSFDIMHKDLQAKYRAPFISDSWTDTKLIRQLEILDYLIFSDRVVAEDFKKKIQGLKDEVADYILLEELSVKKNSSDR